MTYHGISVLGGAVRLIPWLIVLACMIALTSVPTSLSVQALLGVGAFAAIFLMRGFVNTRFGRMIILAIASAVVMRYWFWRLYETLPAFEDHASFAAAVALFAVETYLIGVFFLSCIVMADPVDHGRPKPLRVRDLPTVDVLIPSMNEPVELLAVTLAAAKNMSYPEPLLNVVLCDDGGTHERCMHPDPAIAIAARARRDELTALCEKLGVLYRTRPENRGAKAGNLTEALAGLDGELVAIFDADHMPARDFLARTVGYFAEEPKLALVQTPHFFLNKDPIARNLDLSDRNPPENEMFYSVIHRGLDRWGGAFFCGSAAVLRREAIDSVGGISGRTITEDAETSMLIHGKGWRTMYVNHALVAGLQPESFASFLQQRGRWATGMVQLLVTRNPFLVRGLSFWQRLCYLNSMSYWAFPLVRLVLLLAPLVYLFFGLEIVVTTAEEAFAYMGSYLVVAYMVQNILFSTVRWPFMSEIYEIAQTPYLIRAIAGAVFRPRSASFKVTSKEETIGETRISDVGRPLIFLFMLMLAGIAALVWRWNAYPGDRQVLQIVGAWVLFNTLLTAASLRALVEKQQRRVAPRAEDLNVPAVIDMTDANGETVAVPCVISNISYSGMGVSIPPRALSRDLDRPAQGDILNVTPASGNPDAAPGAIACEVQSSGSQDGRLVLGVSFDSDQDREGFQSIATIFNGDSRRWQQIRVHQTSKAKGLIAGFLMLIRLSLAGLFHTGRALSGAEGRGGRLNANQDGPAWSDETSIEEQAFIFAQSQAPRRTARRVADRPVATTTDATSGQGALGDPRTA